MRVVKLGGARAIWDNRDTRDPMSGKDDDDDSSAPRWAADEPTAMWDDSVMAESGYQDLAKDRSEKPRAESAPATDRGVKGEDRSKVTVSGELTGGHAALPAAAPQRSVTSWILTALLAVALGAAAYFAVRFLR